MAQCQTRRTLTGKPTYTSSLCRGWAAEWRRRLTLMGIGLTSVEGNFVPRQKPCPQAREHSAVLGVSPMKRNATQCRGLHLTGLNQVQEPRGSPRTIAKSGRGVYKDREVRVGSVMIWRQRNLCSSAWSRCRTPGGPGESAIPFKPSPVFTRAGSAADPAGLGLRSDHHGPHRPLRQVALAGAEGASGVCSGPPASRHHHLAHPVGGLA